MKILLSAYACEPDKGSEPAVGWNWAQALLHRGHEVQVITRSNNRDSIENALQAHPSSLVVAYYDLNRLAQIWKHWPGGLYMYYLLWQIGAYRVARRLHAAEKFDRVHHVTFASFRQPSFMGCLGIPFIFGPVGGGETMPAHLRAGIPFMNRMAEAVRDLGSSFVAWDPFMQFTFSRACRIACTTEETLARISRRYHAKCIVQLAIGINNEQIDLLESSQVKTPSHHPQFLFVGRLLYWKGIHLAVRAFAQVRRSLPEARLKIIGDGPDHTWLKTVGKEAGVEQSIEWLPAKPHEEIAEEYRESLALIFPSLHDSGGMVVLEALATGLPVICLDLGGPGAIVTPSCGIVVKGRHNSEAVVVESLARAMILLATDAGHRTRLSANALQRAKQMTWDAIAQAIDSSLVAKE